MVEMAVRSAPHPVGDLLRQWRERRRLSQQRLANDAEVSARHLSFVETGRSTPSRELVLHLADHLDVPLRERNQLLLAAGYAPVFGQRPLDSPEMTAVRGAVRTLLGAHEPYPAMAVDQHWNVVEANAGMAVFTELVDPALLHPTFNIVRAALHPAGLAPHIVNLDEWRGHIINRMRRRAAASGDAVLAALHEELSAYPGGLAEPSALADVALPLRLRRGSTELVFLAALVTFGSPLDVTVAELTVEQFFPADEATARALRQPGPGDRS
jgi:transcriptional regulator with XRE-family HTH domain